MVPSTPESKHSSLISKLEQELKDGTKVTLEVHNVESLSEEDSKQLDELVRGAFPGTDDIERPFMSRFENRNAGVGLVYLARSQNGEIVGVHSAIVLNSFSTAPEHANRSVIQFGSATVKDSHRKHGVMTALTDLSFKSAPDDIIQAVKTSGRYDSEEAMAAVIKQLGKNPIIFIETALETGSDAGKPRVGPELRKMLVERAIAHGWDPNHPDLETMTGDFYQVLLVVEALQEVEGANEKMYRIEFAGSNNQTETEEINVGTKDAPNPIQIRERISRPVLYQLDLSESKVREVFTQIAKGLNSTQGEEQPINKVAEELDSEDPSELIAVVISPTNPGVDYSTVEARVLQLMNEQAQSLGLELKRLEGLLQEVRTAFARPTPEIQG